MNLRGVKPAVLALTLTFVAATSVSAAPIHIISGGLLVGATGVEVSGTLYDVEFVEGTCIEVFDGCDEFSDFAFNGELSALEASGALSNQVLVFTAAANFDRELGLTFGCDPLAFACEIQTPWAPLTPSEVAVGSFVNIGLESGRFIDFIRNGMSYPTNAAALWAKWSLAEAPPPSSIPEPSSLLLIGTGAVGLVGRMRRWRNTATQQRQQ